MRKRIYSNMEFAVNVLNKIDGLKVILPEGGYYLIVYYHLPFDEEELCVRLIRQGVLVHPGYFFGDLRENAFVISGLADRKALICLVEAISKINLDLHV